MNGSGSPSASATQSIMALREQFGDRKPPDIKRKITACVACRKQKIKCNMRDGQPPCVRCKKRGLSCTVNRSLQMILESDAIWKEVMERKIRVLESALGKVANHLSIPEILEEADDDEDDIAIAKEPHNSMPTPTRGSQVGPSPHAEKHTTQHTPHNFEIVMDPDSGPAAIPGSVVSPIAIPGLEKDRAEQDIITRGIVTEQQAQSYLDIYQNRLDHFLYRIIGDRKSLSEVRADSPLLLAAICAVGALHLATSDFEKCYQEFVTIAAAQTFSRRNNVDDIRGLLVGAFWLSGISWTCIGAAVRISTEIQLHRSIFKALQGERSHYLRARLYYLVFVCDHHFSIAYGRPPMTRQDDSIRAALQFLETEHAVEDDARLMSQVQFWSVGSEIYQTFGVDVDRPLDASSIDPIRRFSISLDRIRADWTQRFHHNRYVGNYPRKGVGLHYHFAKLYLYSMAFRGIGKPGFKAPDVALDIDELANSAVLSATAILRAVVNDTEIQDHLNGLPTYFDVMIAFAVVFVLKVSTKYANSVRVDTSEVRTLVSNLVMVLKNVTAEMHPRHLLVSVARGAETLLERASQQVIGGPVPANAHVTMSQPNFDESLFDMATDWNGASFDNFFMGEFDFLSNQDAMQTYQPDLNYNNMPQM
ncbi:Transcriptional activator of proteases prtT [Pseudocercospora fuligena]|uniref:Transcriptional activator of proteases prtT n=1 Tax=Pseudocercospora fuligena TaxID=685502 RepID=A0A8H6VKQ3_9PEZI|nr:Transcriptional activator of proteases prtT [Pseudocercospora fuligena]